MHATRALAFFVCLCALGCEETVGPILWQTFALGGPTPTMQYGGPGGSQAEDLCRPNEAVIGYEGTLAWATIDVFVTPGDASTSFMTRVIGSIQTLCGSLTVGGNGQLLTMPSEVLASRGGSQGGIAWQQPCPVNQVVVGFSGRAGAYVDQLAFICAPWFLETDAGSVDMDAETAGASSWQAGPTTTLPLAGGMGGGAFTPEACPPGQMAIGTATRSGEYVDSFGLVCATPSL